MTYYTCYIDKITSTLIIRYLRDITTEENIIIKSLRDITTEENIILPPIPVVEKEEFYNFVHNPRP